MEEWPLDQAPWGRGTAAGAGRTRLVPSGSALPSSYYVDVPCDVFLPSKANPTTRMSTATVIEQTSDGLTWQHGYNDFSQTYDLMVSGYQDYGVILEESVAIALAPIPAEVTPYNVDGVEFRFVLTETNNYPSEMTGLVDITSTEMPHSQSTENQWDQWFYDARGLWGNIYFIGNFPPRAYAIDLGPDAIADMEDRVGYPGWFGVGMAADAWDLADSPGTLVYNTSAGGGDATPGLRPYFRIYYNVPPDPFDLVEPVDGAATTQTHPTFRWQRAHDPNRGDIVLYTLQYDVSPAFTAPVQVDGLADTTFTAAVPLAPGSTYWWRVRALDCRQNTRWSATSRSLVIQNLSAVGDLPARGGVMGRPFPNPAAGPVALDVAPGGGRIEILDVMGRLVREIETPPAGGLVHWDARSAAGSDVPSGTYYLRFTGPGGRQTRTLRLIR